MKNEEKGKEAYPRKGLLKVVLLCILAGRGSLRQMEKACERDLWCRLYMQGMRPDHATFGRFLQQVGESRIAMMFKGVVESLYNLGFIEFDEVAHDGTKVGGVADRKKNVNREEVKGLAAKALAHYREVREGRVRKRLGKGVEDKERKKALKDAGKIIALAIAMEERKGGRLMGFEVEEYEDRELQEEIKRGKHGRRSERRFCKSGGV